MARRVVEALTSEPRIKLLDIGCGEGRDTVFFAQAGFEVVAFDHSLVGVKKTRVWLEKLGL